MTTSENEKKFLDELIDFNRKEHIKELNLPKEIEAMITDKIPFHYYSTKNRVVDNAHKIKYNILMERTGTIVTCFKASFDTTSAIYAYTYSKYDPSNKKQPIKHQYVCCSPTYRSQDGEYRHRLILWPQFDAFWEKYAEIVALVEEYVLPQIESKALEFYTFFYYPFGFLGNERQMEESVNSLRLPIRLFIMCWLVDFNLIHNSRVENHVNPAYQYIIHQKGGIAVYNKIREKLDENQYNLMVNRISQLRDSINASERLLAAAECGQKIMPMTLREAIRSDDINFPTWREIYMSILCSNLVLNFISPSFPFINNWFYIQNSNGTLYDNLPMHDKYSHSQIADEINEQLRLADRYNYHEGDRKQGPINNKFMRLSKLIEKSESFADAYIRLTEMSICITSEYVGRTVRDLPVLAANSPYIAGLEYIFTSDDLFAKHMFEFIYGFYCMNTKIGILHSDLHINNATFFKLFTMIDDQKKPYFVKNPKILYLVGKTKYLFPQWGVYSCIIDFSRGIIGNVKLLERDFGPRFAEQYFKDQRARVLRVLYHYFPKFTEKYQPKLEAIMITDFNILFKILTGVDSLSISSAIAAMFQIDDLFKKGKIKLGSKMIPLLNKIAQRSESLLLELLQQLVEDKFKSENDFEWPNLTLLGMCFESFIVSDKELAKMAPDIDLCDIFNYSNEIQYSVEDYDTYGPLLSKEKELELLAKWKLPVTQEILDWREYISLDETNKIDSIISKYENQEPEIEISSWMLY